MRLGAGVHLDGSVHAYYFELEHALEHGIADAFRCRTPVHANDDVLTPKQASS